MDADRPVDLRAPPGDVDGPCAAAAERDRGERDLEPVRSPAGTRPRIAWLDIARGAAVALVVFGHVWRGLHEAGVLATGPLFESVDRAIYLFHMPLFFLLSGLVFPPMIRRAPGAFLGGRAWRLLYPMALWTYLLIGLRLLAPGGVNHPTSAGDLLRLPLPPFELFWFVWALFLIQLAAYAVLRAAGRGGRVALAATGVMAAGAAIALFHGADKNALAVWIAPAMRNLPYFALGVLCAAGAPRLGRIGRGGALAGAAVVALCIAIDQSMGPGPWARTLLAVSAACGFTALVAGLVGGLAEAEAEKGLAGRGLTVIGQGAMAVFLMHVVFAAATRIALSAAGVENLAVHVTLGTVAGIAGPLAALVCARRLKLDRAAGF
ncbi:Fucose 4-O-acetylase [Albimonas donghaensis]|uniref:Fucose 4-O-acetylase n=1 Tax=Albimonas donghaensis TaxID=356660 RepID=A0A1H3FML0_9RHOB|nr:acyltransferase [Albimonas donghaensis]SDX92323.1 Fucose 4-O-acetylase [Albimonas donghaensis]